MKLKDIYKKIDSLNEAVNMSISMSGETADDVATLMKMVKDAGGKPEVITPMPKMSPRDVIEKRPEIRMATKQQTATEKKEVNVVAELSSNEGDDFDVEW